MSSFGLSDPYEHAGRPVSAQKQAFQKDVAVQQDLGHVVSLQLGEQLRQWQAEKREKDLQSLLALILMVARRLMAEHHSWAIQEQVHLDYMSLEVRARPDAMLTLVECRFAEDLISQETHAVELSVFGPGCFRKTIAPKLFKRLDENAGENENADESSGDFDFEEAKVLMGMVLSAVEHDVAVRERAATACVGSAIEFSP